MEESLQLVPFSTTYASGNTGYITQISSSNMSRGVIPRDSLPAQWWNYLNNAYTQKINQVYGDLTEIKTEIDGVGTYMTRTADSSSAGSVQIPSSMEMATAIEKRAQRIATSSLQGTVKSSAYKGDIAVRNDGTMTMNGYGEILEKTGIYKYDSATQTYVDNMGALGASQSYTYNSIIEAIGDISSITGYTGGKTLSGIVDDLANDAIQTAFDALYPVGFVYKQHWNPNTHMNGNTVVNSAGWEKSPIDMGWNAYGTWTEITNNYVEYPYDKIGWWTGGGSRTHVGFNASHTHTQNEHLHTYNIQYHEHWFSHTHGFYVEGLGKMWNTLNDVTIKFGGGTGGNTGVAGITQVRGSIYANQHIGLAPANAGSYANSNTDYCVTSEAIFWDTSTNSFQIVPSRNTSSVTATNNNSGGAMDYYPSSGGSNVGTVGTYTRVVSPEPSHHMVRLWRRTS